MVDYVNAAGMLQGRSEIELARYTGDYQGRCTACDEYVEFAVGIRPGTDPLAMCFGPGGPQPVEIEDLNLEIMIDDAMDVRFRYTCPICGRWSSARVTCRIVPGPQP
jgi:hypothetical protein